jgi:hypothetical protein
MNERLRYRKSILDRPVADQFELIKKEKQSVLLRHLLLDTSTSEYQVLIKA